MPYSDKKIESIKKKEYYKQNKESILQKQKERYNSTISIGDTFGELTIISKENSYKSISSKGKKSSRLMWKVRCSCGSEFITSGTKLRRKDIVMCNSCACKRRPQSARKYGNVEYAFKKLILDRATKKDIKVDLILDAFQELATQPCYYCGKEPEVRPYLTTRNIEFPVNGIDRKDNSKGYEKHNCVPCCKTCNIAKSTMNEKDFLSFISRVYHYSVK